MKVVFVRKDYRYHGLFYAGCDLCEKARKNDCGKKNGCKEKGICLLGFLPQGTHFLLLFSNEGTMGLNLL